MKDKLLKNFRNPPAEYRGVPFWAWNAKLDKKELVRQIRIMKDMGMGGFFIHSRVGLDTEYLSSEWFSCIRSCIGEAKKCSMEAWLYDEDRWPSGSAGGRVTKEDRFKLKSVNMEVLPRKKNAEKKGFDLAFFAVKSDGIKLHSMRRVKSEKARKEAGESIIRIYWDYMKRDSWYNGETYLDTMNPAAVEEFMRVTHEEYRKRFSQDFGKTVPGIFTDEPSYSHLSGLPWSSAFEEIFRERFGYDLLDFIPELFFRGRTPVSRARSDYYELATGLFAASFGKKIGDWCGKNNLMLTGHVFLEDSLLGLTQGAGSPMRFYEHMQLPGVDVVSERMNIFITVKQCTSAAHQFGRKRRLSETYGGTGWDFPVSGYKAVGDWQYALGINFRCLHHAWYSIEAEAKRDFPPSIFFQEPYYPKFRLIEDYFARLGAVLAEGEEVRDILFIHPNESFHAVYVNHPQYPAECYEPAVKRDKTFVRQVHRLLEENLDFDFGDEDILARHGKAAKGAFTVGKASYQAVLIPELTTIRSTTLSLLSAFAAKGGTVCYIGKAPAFVDSVPSEQAKKAYNAFIPAANRNFTDILSAKSRRISITDTEGKEIAPVLSRLAVTGKSASLFLCNTGTKFRDDQTASPVSSRTLSFPCVKVRVNMPCPEYVYELDPADGAVYKVKFAGTKNHISFRTSLRALESRLFLFTDQAVPEAAFRKEKTYHKQATLSGPWNFTAGEHNVLVLDHADAEVSGKTIAENGYMLQIDDSLRELLGQPPRGMRMVQPYTRKNCKPAKKLPLALTCRFRCAVLPESGCLLALEHPEFYRITVNGKTIRNKSCSCWSDPVLQCVSIPASLLVMGENRIRLETEYHENLPGLESMFLLGHFGVEKETLVEYPETLKPGSLTSQNMPYYSGNITYSMTFRSPAENAKLRIPAWKGSLLGIRVNGGDEILLGWAPWEAELTDLKKGENRIEITVYGHRRNSFGPFYTKEETGTVSPGHFREYATSGKRRLTGFGLLEAPVIAY